MKTRRRLALGFALAILPAMAATLLVAPTASAHGAPIIPGSRTYLCWVDGLRNTGEIIPHNPACAAAIAQSGPTPLYNWFGVLRSDAGGRTVGFIPDGKLCSGNATVFNFSGFDQAHPDWPLTHLTAGASIQFRYNNWADHPGTFYVHITRDGWNPNQPLRWSDLEEPFLEITNPPSTGGPGSADNYYFWTGNLPSGKTGRHIIYMRWVRSDSQENFFSCSDVVFDGGNGEVTGVGPGCCDDQPASTRPAITPRHGFGSFKPL